jgi:hypothetical protein
MPQRYTLRRSATFGFAEAVSIFQPSRMLFEKGSFHTIKAPVSKFLRTRGFQSRTQRHSAKARYGTPVFLSNDGDLCFVNEWNIRGSKWVRSGPVKKRNGRCCRGVDLWQSPSRVAPSGLGDILGTAPWVDTHGYNMPPRLGLNAGESEKVRK